jgi:hypothetical protein
MVARSKTKNLRESPSRSSQSKFKPLYHKKSRTLNQFFIVWPVARRIRMTTREKELRKRPIAPESQKTKRAREKLVKQWNEEKELINPKALEKTVEKIHQWIADNAKYRIPIKEKSIKLFNQNKEAARISKKVQVFAERLRGCL